MTCSLERSVSHPGVLAVAEGSVQILNDSGMLVGFGAEPYFSRFSAQGELLVDGHLPKDVTSYRAFVADFATVPTDKPAVALGAAANGKPYRLRQLEWGNRSRGMAGLRRRNLECLICGGNGRLGRLRDGVDREQCRALLPGCGVGCWGARARSLRHGQGDLASLFRFGRFAVV